MKYNLKNLLYFFKKRSETELNITYADSTTDQADFTSDYPKNKEYPDTFFLQLAQVIAWTETILTETNTDQGPDYEKIFRRTNPLLEGKPFYQYSDKISFIAPYYCFDYLDLLKQALEKRPGKFTYPYNAISLGKVLEFDINLTTRDGAPTANSQGFVDENDAPPIDTWFYLTKSHLYCWIPNICIPVMQDAINVEIYDAYRWIRDSNPSLQKKIEDFLISNP